MKKLLLILICVLAPVFISGCLRLDVHVETPEPEESSDAVLEAAARELIDFIQNGTEIPETYAVPAVIVTPEDDLTEVMPEYTE